MNKIWSMSIVTNDYDTNNKMYCWLLSLIILLVTAKKRLSCHEKICCFVFGLLNQIICQLEIYRKTKSLTGSYGYIVNSGPIHQIVNWLLRMNVLFIRILMNSLVSLEIANSRIIPRLYLFLSIILLFFAKSRVIQVNSVILQD